VDNDRLSKKKTALERGKERKAMTLMIMHISLDIWKSILFIGKVKNEARA
jgi:hypothetical protein